MGAILPFVSGGAFEPSDIQAMSLAYEDICDALHINGDISVREAIAARVIELARGGERCPTVLRDRVLAEANGDTGIVRLGVAAWGSDVSEQALVMSPGLNTRPAHPSFFEE